MIVVLILEPWWRLKVGLKGPWMVVWFGLDCTLFHSTEFVSSTQTGAGSLGTGGYSKLKPESYQPGDQIHSHLRDRYFWHSSVRLIAQFYTLQFNCFCKRTVPAMEFIDVLKVLQVQFDHNYFRVDCCQPLVGKMRCENFIFNFTASASVRYCFDLRSAPG